MKIRLQQITSTPSGLVMGVQILGPRESWIRFGMLEVPWTEITPNLIEDYWRWADRDERLDEADTPLLFEWGDA